MQKIETQQEWHALVALSEREPVVICKHSNACGGSARALAALVQAEREGHFALHVVIVQDHPDIVHAIAADAGVAHASPQALVVARGRAVYDASHGMIDPADIAACVQSYRADLKKE